MKKPMPGPGSTTVRPRRSRATRAGRFHNRCELDGRAGAGYSRRSVKSRLSYDNSQCVVGRTPLVCGRPPGSAWWVSAQTRDRPTRGSAADQGVRPTQETHDDCTAHASRRLGTHVVVRRRHPVLRGIVDRRHPLQTYRIAERRHRGTQAGCCCPGRSSPARGRGRRGGQNGVYKYECVTRRRARPLPDEHDILYHTDCALRGARRSHS